MFTPPPALLSELLPAMKLELNTLWYRPLLELDSYPERVMAVSDAVTNLLLEGRYRQRPLVIAAHLERLRGPPLGEGRRPVHLHEVRSLGSGRCLFVFDQPKRRYVRAELLGTLQAELDLYGM